MRKKDVVEVVIDRLDFPNKGVGHCGEHVVTVKNTLEGQVVSACINKKRAGKIEGRLLEVVKRAGYEIEPKCPHFNICGGCSYQNISYADELELKKNQVLSLLENAGVEISIFEGIHPSPRLEGYRNKCEFSFGDEEKGGELALGMRKRGSFYEVVNLTDCNIIDSDYLKIISSAVSFFREMGTAFYHKMRHDGELRHLVVRKSVSGNEILVNLVTTGDISFSPAKFAECILSAGTDAAICGVLHTVNNGVADIVKSDFTSIIYGRDYFVERIFNLDFKIGAFSFFQTNSYGVEDLYSIVRDFAGDCEDKVVFDLYCGTGTIGQIMAEKSRKVVGIEIVGEAVEAANENAAKNGIKNCVFIAGDVLKKVDELTDKPDLIILDPPRDGIHPKAVSKIAGFGAPEIIYVSCKPTSLARDLPLLRELRYEADRICCMDMFPRTANIETVVKLSLRPGQSL